MNRFFQLYCVRLQNGSVKWFPVNCWRLSGVMNVVWRTNPLPAPYQGRLIAEFDAFVGFRVVRVEEDVEWLADYVDAPCRLDSFDPLLGEALLSMLPTGGRKAWDVPGDPFTALVPMES